jgi:8-oxo-dGTP pyrophosphatase MutT (NUDIX family)
MPWTDDFAIRHERPRTVQLLDSSQGQDTSNACNAALKKVISNATLSKAFKVLASPLHEDYIIIGANFPVQMERTASSLFGIAHRGAHMTVYTRTAEGMKIWVPRRAPNLFTYPNMLDTTVAGGVKAEQSPWECIIQEADEEASLSESLVRSQARSSGVLTYLANTSHGDGGEHGLMVPDCLYVFDLEVAEDVVPKPRDGEVKEFYLWDVGRVKEALSQAEFKTNCAAVMIDFFIRHGIITNENERDYLEIMSRMHRKLPVPTSRVSS